MDKLKGVIFSLRDVIFHKGHNDSALFAQLEKLILWLRDRDVQPVFVGNHGWAYNNSDGTSTDVRKVLKDRWGEFPWYIASEGDMPFKPLHSRFSLTLLERDICPILSCGIPPQQSPKRLARPDRLLATQIKLRRFGWRNSPRRRNTGSDINLPP